MNRKKLSSAVVFIFLVLLCFAKGEKAQASNLSYGVYTKQSATYNEQTGNNTYKNSNSTYLCGQPLYLEIGTAGQSYMNGVDIYVDGSRIQVIKKTISNSPGYYWAWAQYTFNTAGTHKIEWKGALTGSGESFSYSKTIYLNKISRETYRDSVLAWQSVTYGVSVSGSSSSGKYSYQWYYSDSANSTVKHKVSNATQNRYSFTANSSYNGRCYYCEVSDSNGGVSSTSEGFALHIQYQITYNANGGNGAPASQLKNHDATLTLSSNKPTRAGYTFLGWASTSLATVPEYQAGASYTNNQGITLYAIWKSVAANATSMPIITETPKKGGKSSKEKKIPNVTGVKAYSSYEKSSGFRYKKVVRVTWNPVAADGFFIYRREGKAKEKRIAVLSSGQSSQYWDSKAQIGVKYTYRIRAFQKGLKGKKSGGKYSKRVSVKIGRSMKQPKLKWEIKNSVRTNKNSQDKNRTLSIHFLTIEGQSYESQYRWMNDKKWNKQSKIQGRIQNKTINKTLLGKNFLLRIRSYYTVKGKKVYSKWSAPLKIK